MVTRYSDNDNGHRIYRFSVQQTVARNDLASAEGDSASCSVTADCLSAAQLVRFVRFSNGRCHDRACDTVNDRDTGASAPSRAFPGRILVGDHCVNVVPIVRHPSIASLI